MFSTESFTSVVRDPHLRSGCDSVPRSDLVASRSDLGVLVSLSAIFFTVYPIIDVPSPLSFARENRRRDSNRERDRCRDLPLRQETSRA